MSDDAIPQGSDRVPTLSDVAKLAEVSTMTVSRVINENAKVAAATRARVHAAMASLDYQPNLLARGLASGRSRNIGMLTVDTNHYGPGAALRGIELAARERGYSVTITHLADSDQTAVAQGMALLRSRSCDGLIVLQPMISGADQVLPNSAERAPVVAIHAGDPSGYPVVSVDQRTGAKLATQHLLDLGHRTVWHVAGPQNWWEGAQRVQGWRDALHAAGAAVPEIVAGDWSAASGYAAGRSLLDSGEVTAIFVGNDSMALGVLHAMYERGLRCPEDVSLVGFDDSPEAAFLNPGLTTIRQDFDEIGRLSVAVLVELIENGELLDRPLTLEPELIIRASAAAPRR